MKIRLFPTEKEKELLHQTERQFRWNYNAYLCVLQKEYERLGKKLEDERSIRVYAQTMAFRKYRYVETVNSDGVIESDFVYEEDRSKNPSPDWLGVQHSRTARGAICKLVFAINAALSNFRAKNIKKFEVRPLVEKSDRAYFSFEDKGFPAYLKHIKSKYIFTNNEGKKQPISFMEIFKSTKQRGLEVIFEKHTGKYFILYSVDTDYFPEGDRRIERQPSLFLRNSRIISLDPGVRKFMVGYDPTGKCVFFGVGAEKRISRLIYTIDRIRDTASEKQIFHLQKKLQDLISDLHWKTIYFLVKNYDTIILPDFRVKKLEGKLPWITTRLLFMFSFYTFKQRLWSKCDIYGKRLVIVDESYTSKTCGKCGGLKKLGSSEVYDCNVCGLQIDRDVNGSRNIFIKNVRLVKS